MAHAINALLRLRNNYVGMEGFGAVGHEQNDLQLHDKLCHAGDPLALAKSGAGVLEVAVRYLELNLRSMGCI